jgi:hypothetical protein
MRHKDGHIFPLEVNAQTVRNQEGKPLYLLAIVRDISERKRTEQALRKNEAQLRTIISALPDRALIIDSDGYYHEVLKAAFDAALFLSPGSGGRYLQDIFEPQFADFCLRVVRETIAKDTPQFIEYEVNQDGTPYYFEGRVIPYHAPFLGEVSDEELRHYYAASDVVVLPSSHRSESFGQVLLEAMAAGRPVVSTELGTGTSFVNEHGKTGMVVANGDADALANAVNVLLLDPERRASMGARGQRRVIEEFHVERMVDRTIEVYRQALVANGHSAATQRTAPAEDS